VSPVVALVPMRHHSVRVPGKNYRKLGDVPLYHHVVRTLLSCRSVSEIVIDTDSEVIREDARRAFPGVRLLERPSHLCADETPMTEVLVHDATQVCAPLYLQTHSTNPFLKMETIEAALRWWETERGEHDSLFSVTRLQARLWDGEARPLNHDPHVLLQTQALRPIYLENSCLYIYPRELILSSRQRIGKLPKLWEIDPREAIDIDEERDFVLAELIVAAREVAKL
jgi:CMP-N-acetylneuraminic acid synthetase